MTENKKSLTAAVTKEIQKKFDLDKFKTSKKLKTNTAFKDQKWLPLSKAFQETLSIPGIPLGNITILRGHSDSGKTTCLMEAAASAQKVGILPVFIVTEMKWNWEYARNMGVEFEEVETADGKKDYKGFFIYADRETIHTIEDVAVFILDLIDEQKKGNLPFDLIFLWDSVGSVPCEMSVKSNKNNNEWNAGAMSTQFGNSVNQKIVLSRKESYPYTNTLVVINKVWTAKPEMPMGQPRLMNKGGWAMWFDATLMITFGNVSNAGTSKIKAQKDNKTIEFAKRTNIHVEKNHINGIATRGKIIMTSHGFIVDTPTALNKYKDKYADEWGKILGGGNFEILEEEDDISPPIIFDNEPE